MIKKYSEKSTITDDCRYYNKVEAIILIFFFDIAYIMNCWITGTSYPYKHSYNIINFCFFRIYTTCYCYKKSNYPWHKKTIKGNMSIIVSILSGVSNFCMNLLCISLIFVIIFIFVISFLGYYFTLS